VSIKPDEVIIGEYMEEVAPAMSLKELANHNVITAYHEAGHAVVGRHLGLRITSIGLMSPSNRTTRGVTRLGRPSERVICLLSEMSQNCPQLWQAIQIVFSWSGLAAEARFAGNQAHLLRESWGEQADVEDVERLEKGMSCSEATQNRLIHICSNHLMKQWHVVDALARALLDDGRIVRAKDIRWICGPRTMPLRKVYSEIASALDTTVLPCCAEAA
jgi:hypothetical protein